MVGLPVFSGTPEKGVWYSLFCWTDYGILIRIYFCCVLLSGYFKFNKNIILNFFKLILSVSVIYTFGVLWLGTLIGWDKPVGLGVKPFLLAEFFKIVYCL